MTTNRKAFDITIKPHPHSPDEHSIAIVTLKGRSHWCSWAGVPTEADVRDAWNEDRGAFRPYNCLMWG